jgi:hypothetical protein
MTFSHTNKYQEIVKEKWKSKIKSIPQSFPQFFY